MAVIGVAATIQDLARRLDPNGKVDKIVEILNKTNLILEDFMLVEGNLPIGHKTTIRTGLPTVAWRKLNYGVQPSKSTTMQVVDTCGMLEAYAQVDKELADLNGNSAEWRLSEEQPFTESMNQAMAETLFYGDTDVYPERFLGLVPRYSSLSASNGTNIIDAAGTGGDNTSIWLIVWGPNTVHGTYPKGSKIGLTHQDLGEVTLQDDQNPPGLYQGYRSHYQWKLGLTLRDWRYVARIANIDVSDLATFGQASGDVSAKLIRLLIQAYHKIPNLNMGRAAIYCNETIMTWLDIMVAEKTTAMVASTLIDGKPVTAFRGIPIRKTDAILNTEARVA